MNGQMDEGTNAEMTKLKDQGTLVVEPTSELIKKWRIAYNNGFMIECYRQRKPTQLANSWATAENPDGSAYGDYTIEYCGTFNKQILDGRRSTVARSAASHS
jgi:superfamily II DNA or RNA helicase